MDVEEAGAETDSNGYPISRYLEMGGEVIIATARKLIRIAGYMLRNGTPFNPYCTNDLGLRKVTKQIETQLPVV